MKIKNYIKKFDGIKNYSPKELLELYNFPNDADGTGQKIGFIELGGGYNQEVLNSYFSKYNINCPLVKFIPIGGATNDFSNDEIVMLDLITAISVSPKITPIVYMARNSFQGFVDAIKRAMSDKVDIICINWGCPKLKWTNSYIEMMNKVLKNAISSEISVICTYEDSEFPSCSPYVATYIPNDNNNNMPPLSPLLSGLVSLLNQKLGENLGFLNPNLYSFPKEKSDENVIVKEIKKLEAEISISSLLDYQGSGIIQITGCSENKYRKYYPALFSVGTRVYIKSKASRGILESVVIKKIKVNESDIFTKVQPIIAYVDTLNRVWEENELIEQQDAIELVEATINNAKNSFSKLDACRRNAVYKSLQSKFPNKF